VDDLEAALDWYTASGRSASVRSSTSATWVGFGPDGGSPSYWIGKATEPGGRQTHIAFVAERREVVDAVCHRPVT
jgi:hypothetical protein